MNKKLFITAIVGINMSVWLYPVKAQIDIPRPDYKLSPFTGYTRAHWLDITEKIIAGALLAFNDKTGLPDFEVAPNDPGYDSVRWKSPEESRKRALERIMMAVVIYTKATGKDRVPGYNGSITEPFIKALISGTDPHDAGFWGDPLPNDQVGSVFAMAAYLTPERFWAPLTLGQRSNLLNYFKKQAYNNTYNNNHYYFHMIAVALLEKNGYDGNREHLTQMYQRLMGWYRGNGWFLDGNNRGFDYYNLWGFQLFNQVLYRFDPKWHDKFGGEIRQTTTKFLETYPYLYGRDGAPVPWGRSLTYRFASNSAIAWAVLNHMSSLPAGEARRIASGSLKYFFDHGCLDKRNLLPVGYWGANAGVAEGYIDYGDPYWACQGLACLLIPAEDPFWTAVEQPMPADGKGGTKMVTGAQFVLKVSAIDGEARLFPAGQPWGKGREQWEAGAKYDQHAYSSFLGFCLQGDGAKDIGAGRTGYSYDGKKWLYRERAKPLFISENHLVSSYTLQLETKADSMAQLNRDEMITHTLIGSSGELHIFWHNNPDPIYLYLGGYGIPLPEGQKLTVSTATGYLEINDDRFHSLITAVQTPVGKFDYETLEPRKGWSQTHLYGGLGTYPYWRSTMPVPPNTPVIFYVNGTRDRKTALEKVVVKKQQDQLNIMFEKQWYKVAVPF